MVSKLTCLISIKFLCSSRLVNIAHIKSTDNGIGVFKPTPAYSFEHLGKNNIYFVREYWNVGHCWNDILL